MKKPLIGIVPLVDTERESYWMLPGYMKGIEEAGGIPFMLPLTQDNLLIRQLVEICDGILLTGGQDVSPEIYGEEKLKVMAKSTDGLVESVYMPGKKFIWATQWHPEFSYKIDESSRKIFECFIKSSSSK